MKRKALALLFVCVLLLTGCGNAKTDSKGGDSDKSTDTKLDNNSKVTKDNFRKFPETSQDAFVFHLSEDGDVNHVDITGVKSPEIDKYKVIVIPSKVKMKTAKGDETKTVVGVSGISHLDNVEAIVIPDSVKTIGTEAFVINKNLKYIQLGNSVEKTGYHLFIGTSLEFLEIPDSMKEMGSPYNDYLIFSNQIAQGTKGRLKYIKIPGTLTEFSNLYLYPYDSDGPIIKTPKGSEGEKWAKYWGFKVECIKGEVVTPEHSIWGEQLEKQAEKEAKEKAEKEGSAEGNSN